MTNGNEQDVNGGAFAMGERIGVVDVGGGFRGIYAAGVLDYCLANSIRFDLY